MSKIMALASEKEYSAMQLSGELDIPISTVYRKLKHLEDAGMIKHVKTIVDHSGNEEKYYRCAIREATVRFREGKVSIAIEKLDYKDKFVTLWKRLYKP